MAVETKMLGIIDFSTAEVLTEFLLPSKGMSKGIELNFGWNKLDALDAAVYVQVGDLNSVTGVVDYSTVPLTVGADVTGGTFVMDIASNLEIAIEATTYTDTLKMRILTDSKYCKVMVQKNSVAVGTLYIISNTVG